MRRSQRKPRNFDQTPAPKPKSDGLKRAAAKAREAKDIGGRLGYEYPIQAPVIMRGVVPEGERAAVAMDESYNAVMYNVANSAIPGGGFPGYPYLSALSCRAEYRNMAHSFSTELTREWIEIKSSQTDGDDNSEKIKALEAEFKRLDVQGVISKAAMHDCFFGRAHIWLEISNQLDDSPLILSKHTVPVGSLRRICTVEPIWTTPATYNSNDPTAPDFFRPPEWFMLGRRVHASRLLTVVTREVADILKPAFNFGGLSLTQMAEPYVDNWLRTRQSVSDLINNFSTTVLATSMDQILQGDDDGTSLNNRADLFTAMRSNKGLMLLDKDHEDLLQINTPLSGLHELQAQSQEHLCSVSRLPAMILTGISPSGLNASSEGEIRVFYDWISAQQNAFWRKPIETILKAAQLSLFGEIDESITFDFVPLYQMTASEMADIRLKNAQTDDLNVNSIGSVSGMEVRERLAADPDSGYAGLDTNILPIKPADPSTEPPPDGLEEGDGEPPTEGATDKSVSEAQHRAMAAAAGGNSTLGIPKKVGEEFIKKDAGK